MIQVRRIRSSEGGSLRAIRLRALEDSPLAFSSTLQREEAFASQVWDSRAAEGAEGARAATFVAICDEGVGPSVWVGLATVLGVGHPGLGHSDVAELVSMWIAPETRRRGIGQLLVKRAIRFAAESKAPALELSVLQSSTGARELYEGLGFQPCTDRQLPENHACSGEARLRHPLAAERAR